MLPQTGFQSHARGNLIKQKVESGFYQQAIDIMEKHRVKIDVDKLSKLKERPENHVPSEEGDAISSSTYKQCKKMLPHIDTLIVERLRSQTSVSTSLMQSLYADMKVHIREELDIAEKHLEKLKGEADLIEGILSDLVIEHFWERIVIIVVCGCTFIVCVIAVWAIKKCQMQQSVCCAEMTEKMESILEQVCQSNGNNAARRATTSFDFMGETRPPGLSRALVVRK